MHAPASAGGGLPFRVALAIVLCLHVALRLLVLHFPPEDLSVLREADGRPTGEEILRGSAAKDVLDGPLLRWHDYQLNAFSGGSLVYSLVAVPFVALLGPSLHAVRLVSLLFSGLALAFACATLWRHGGRRAAWAGGVLLALAPPGLALMSSLAYGTHVENLALCAALVASFAGGAERRSARAAFLAGILTGFAIYFGYGVLVLLGALLALEVWRDPRWLVSRTCACKLAGLALGLAPSIAYFVASRAEGVEIYGRPAHEVLVLRDPLQLAGLVGRCFWSDLPASFYFPERLGGVWLGRAVLLALLVLFALALRARGGLRRPDRTRAGVDPATIALAWLIAFVLALCVTRFGIDNRSDWIVSYRYFLPAHLFLVLSAALGLEALSRHAPRAAWAVGAALALAFLAGTLARLRPDERGVLLATDGYNDALHARVAARRYAGDVAALDRMLERLQSTRPPEVQDDMLFAMAQTYRFFLGTEQPLRDVDRRKLPGYERARAHLHERAPEPWRVYFEPVRPGDRAYPPRGQRRFLEERRP